MSTPEQPAGPAGGAPAGGGAGDYGPSVPPMGYTIGTRGDLARMPIPGNAEFAVYLLILIFLAIIWIASDQVGAGLFSILMIVLTGLYLLSRGIAKASRVLEQ
jgi:hypothetical protein